MKWPTRLEVADPVITFLERPDNQLTVETVDNHVYFYAEVNSDRCLDLIRQLRSVDNMLRQERLSRALPPDFPATPIWLHIHSNGGELYAALAASDGLRQIPSPIYSIVEGLSASAATLLSMACTRRYITPSSFMMIHQLTSGAWGTYEQIKDDVLRMDMAMFRLRAFYAQRSRMTSEQIEAIISRDSWFDAQSCLDLGLVDEIYVS